MGRPKRMVLVDHLDSLIRAKVLNREVLAALTKARKMMMMRAILDNAVEKAPKTGSSRALALSVWLSSLLRDLPGATVLSCSAEGVLVCMKDGHNIRVSVEDECQS